MLIDIHLLKNYPPTNLNRDESGTPKSCFFNGSQRGRISSQCLKHSWRSSDDFSNLKLGIRTRYLPEMINDILKERGIDASFLKEVKNKLSKLGQSDTKQVDKKDDDKDEQKFQTKQIMFFSQNDIEAVADVVENSIKQAETIDKFKKITLKEWQNILKVNALPITVDIALFGRMVTDDSFKDVEASLQVAHAISTNVVDFESDFFSAVDDLNKDYNDDSGSAMIGDIDYNSCCYYIYASLDVNQLMENLQGNEDAKIIIENALEGLIRAMTFSNPSGKQNSFAGHVLPGLLCIELKDKKIPISYVNAFAKPVYKNDYMAESVEKLKDEINKVSDCYGDFISVKDRIWFSPGIDSLNPKNSKHIKSFNEVLDICKLWIKEV